MGITSFQVCMDSSNWLQEEGSELDSSSGDIFTCSSPLIERKLRPQHDQPLKCPRCNSTHTKFCYYNNYSLSQPRYFCRSCRRYWTKGGILRNIPVGGGCRKNRKVSSKKSNIVTHQTTNYHNTGSSSSSISNYPETAFSHFSNFIGNINNPSFMLENNPARTDFMESKYEALVGTTSRNQDFIGNVVATGMINEYGEMNNFGIGPNFHGGLLCSTFGLPMDGTINYEGEDIIMGVKPNPMIEWHDQVQGCSNAGNKESFGYLSGGLESWTGLMTTTNPLV